MSWSILWRWAASYSMLKSFGMLGVVIVVRERQLIERRVDWIGLSLLVQMVILFICFKKLLCIGKVQFWFPRVLCGGVSYPFHEVMRTAAYVFIIQHSLDFIFFLFINQFHSWGRLSFAMYFIFFESAKEICIEYIVDSPMYEQFQSIGEWSQYFFDEEGSFSFWCQFLRGNLKSQVLAFQLYFFSYPKWDKMTFLLISDLLLCNLICSSGFILDILQLLDPLFYCE